MKKYTFLVFLFICVTAFAQKDKEPLRSCSGKILDQKNKKRQEMIVGKWRPDFFLGANENYEKLTLKPAVNNDELENKYGQFVEINKDFTFRNYSQGWCGNGCDLEIRGKYSLDTDNHIIFYYNQFIYNGLGCKGQKKLKPFSQTYCFEVKDGVLILKQ
jgi:hypothetical protein